MKKVDFIQSISDLRTEVGVVSGNVDTLVAKANTQVDDVDPEIVTAFTGLKGDVDALNTKAANAPAPAATDATPAATA